MPLSGTEMEEATVADEATQQPSTNRDTELADIARKQEASKPSGVSDKHWRKHRQAAGHLVIIRSHFKSVYLVPMCLISLLLGIVSHMVGVDDPDSQATLGLIWVVSFCLYMNVFIFEWTRAWTYALIVSLGLFVAVGFAIKTPTFDVWGGLGNFLGDLQLVFSKQAFFFFGIFFGLCASLSFIKTRLNYVVMEHNEIQVYRNAMFGDRERISMLNPRVEVRVTDMLEYFHPFYRAGQIIIHGPDRTIVLDNVLQIRRIERITDRLGSSLSVTVTDQRPRTR